VQDSRNFSRLQFTIVGIQGVIRSTPLRTSNPLLWYEYK
jgi:hypothetical protein